MEGGEEEGELRWYGARGHEFIFTHAFTRINMAWRMIAIVVTVYNNESVHINSIANSDPGIMINPCCGRIEPNCDSNGGMCIQFPCISNGNVQQLIIICSLAKPNGTAVNGGTGIDEVRKVADVVRCYEDTLQLSAAN